MFGFNKVWILQTDFALSPIPNFVNILPTGVELIHADGQRQTDA
jgi:hypothetical protein